MMAGFTLGVVRYPYVVVTIIITFSAISFIVPLFTVEMPDFSEPQLGFETRGTPLSNRQTAWNNLMNSVSIYGSLATNPPVGRVIKTPPATKIKQKVINEDIYAKIAAHNMSTTSLARIPFINQKKNMSKWEAILTLKPRTHVKIADNSDELRYVANSFSACGSPNEDYARLVITAGDNNDNSDLFSYENLLSICHMERELVLTKPYESLCETVTPTQCCPSWSLVNYIAILNNRSSCLAIMRDDINATLELLQTCEPFYRNASLKADCVDRATCEAPASCVRFNAVYTIFHYLTDIEWLSEINSSEYTTLKYSMIFLPVAASTSAIPLFENMDMSSYQNRELRIIALDFGIKQTLFNKLLLHDSIFIAYGAVFIILCVLIYTNSWFVTLVTIVDIFLPLIITFFFYTIIYQLKFFPFMNLMATVVSIDIGADNAFIFYNMWTQVETELNVAELLERRLSETFRHTIMSMFVTSITTAVAFFASFFSDITAILCFSVFAGTAVLINFFLMITWFPACLVIGERWGGFLPTFFEQPRRVLRVYLIHFCNCFQDLVVNLVINLRWFWIGSLLTITCLSIFTIFGSPKFELPDSQNIQLFKASNPMELYESIYKNNFAFERDPYELTLVNENRLPLRFVWGVLPVDHGDHMNPHSRGSTVFDSTFDMADPESQVWLYNFCRDIRKQPFYQAPVGLYLSNCFIVQFKEWMKRKCHIHIFELKDLKPCCHISKFPYTRKVFEKCIVDYISELRLTPSSLLSSGVAGPKFSNDLNATVRALVVEFDSSYLYTASLNDLDYFYRSVEKWMTLQLKKAPPGMKNGWFISDLQFYDLQYVLAHGTMVTIFIAMIMALIVFFLVTLNVLVSFYAIFTICCSILSTLGTLVLLGWKLNVLESVAVSTSIGLAVDFSLHYGVHYSLSDTKDNRVESTLFALRRMVGPVTIVALTTAAAGCFMLPSSVEAYAQIGTFLFVVMAISWFYSTFLLGSLLAVAGPQNGFAQFRYADIFRFKGKCPTENLSAVEDMIEESSRKVSMVGISSQVIASSDAILEERLVMLNETERVLLSSVKYPQIISETSGQPETIETTAIVAGPSASPSRDSILSQSKSGCPEDHSPESSMSIDIITETMV